MAPPASCKLGFDPAESAFTLKLSEDAVGSGDDWVSLILSDVGLDAGADISLPLASLENFPLPDLDDVDFSNLDDPESNFEHGIRTSFSEEHSASSSNSDVLFDSLKVLKEVDICPSVHPSARNEPGHGHERTHLDPNFPQVAILACTSEVTPFSSTSVSHTYKEENGMAQCSESGLTYASSDYPDTDMNIRIQDSGSDENNFLVSDISSEKTSSTDMEHGHLPKTSNPRLHSRDPAQQHCANGLALRNTLQISGGNQKFSGGSDNADKSATNKMNRKRKNLDRTSRSSTPEEMAMDCWEKVGNSYKAGENRDEEDDRRQAKLMRNRESAQLSRQRKKIYIDELEEKIKTMASTITELNNTINLISAENINLRRQLGMFGPPPGQAATVPPWMGVYQPGPMVSGRFMVTGSQVPLVPIPRWKSQQATTGMMTKKAKSESKGSAGRPPKRTKKVAGIAAAGLFFFVFILLPINFHFLGLKPILHKQTKVWSASPWHMETSNMVVRAGGRVLTGLSEGEELTQNEHGTRTGFVGYGDIKTTEGYWEARKVPKEAKTNTGCDTINTIMRDPKSGLDMNGSVPLAATLFVPRNDGLVRIEGNLIIHSVLAGDKAAGALNQTNEKSEGSYDRGLALDVNLKAVAVKAAPEEKGALVELQRALAGRSRLNLDGGELKSSVQEDGSFQQWFLEDFTGPVFNAGMCTEVFQFETSAAASSPSPGPSSHVGDTTDLVENRTAWLQENGPRKAGRSVSRSGKDTSYAVPLPPVGHKATFNGSSKNGDGFETEREFGKQKHVRSSVVVSVLTGPEFGDQTKLIGGKGFPQIFVVVLIDSVKYVTYSCMLPSLGSKAHYEMVMG